MIPLDLGISLINSDSFKHIEFLYSKYNGLEFLKREDYVYAAFGLNIYTTEFLIYGCFSSNLFKKVFVSSYNNDFLILLHESNYLLSYLNQPF